MAKQYSAQSIQVLEGLDAVRMRPGMYIGSTGSRGLHHMLWEIVDNAIDEAMGGYATQVDVTIHSDGSVSVRDNGRGLPVDIHPTMGVSGVEVIYTKLHAGGKFNNDNYAYSGGLHGVGASVVNALSKWVNIDVYLNFKHYRMRFESGWDPEQKKVVAGRATGPLETVGNTRQRGTLVRFMPDDAIFETVSFNGETVARRLRELAYLNKGLTITFLDERKPAKPVDEDADEAEQQPRGKQIFCYEGGIVDYVSYINFDRTNGVITVIDRRFEQINVKIEYGSYSDTCTVVLKQYPSSISFNEQEVYVIKNYSAISDWTYADFESSDGYIEFKKKWGYSTSRGRIRQSSESSQRQSWDVGV